MRFFGPTFTPLLNEETAPVVRQALARARAVGNFAAVQVGVQCLGFVAGIVLVRILDQHQYAYFTIANTMQGAINVLADIGISIGLVSIGGRVWHDRARFSQLIATARHLRGRLAVGAILIVAPVLYLMLARNGAPPPYALLLVLLVLAGAGAQLGLGVLAVVPRLHSEISQLQWIDFAGAAVRLVSLVACAFIFLNGAVAVLLGSIAALLQYLMMRRHVSRVIDLRAQENAEDRRAMLGFIRNQAPNAVFFCVQGQITILLISFFGNRVGAVAEIGALGRLAMIVAIFGQLLSNIFAPAFARAQTVQRLRWQYAAIIGAVVAFSAITLGAAAFFPKAFLLILGHRYDHLEHELLLIVAGTSANMLAATLWTLNASKAWVAGSWLYIPLTLATQVALVPWTDFSSVRSVLLFNLLSVLPNLLVNLMLSWRGFSELSRTLVSDDACTR